MSEKDNTTREKILHAAKLVFFQKGYDGTRTRDIASKANVNISMLNYHYRSKEQLFELVMLDALKNFISVIKEVLNDSKTSFETKLELIVSNYIDKFKDEPQLPFFVISQLSKNPEWFIKMTSQSKDIANSVFLMQYQEGLKKEIYLPMHFIHLLMNMGGLIVFPFLISPAIRNIDNISDLELNTLMDTRKKLVFNWLKQMISNE